MNDVDVIRIMLDEIAEKLKLSAIEQWNNSNFSEISDEIFKESNVLLSRNTIKNLVQKVLNNDIDFSPQQSTRSALSIFLGYKNWNNYKQNNPKIQNHNFETSSAIVEEVLPIIKNNKTQKYFYLFILLLAMVLVSMFIFYTKVNKKELPPFLFNLSDTTGKSPHTITFSYDFSAFSGDSVFLDLDVYSAAGKYELKYLPNKKGVENFCYYNPGLYKPALYVNGKKVKEYTILIVSNKWKKGKRIYYLYRFQ